MHAFRIIQAFLLEQCPFIHTKRRDCLARMTQAAQVGGLGVCKSNRPSVTSRTFNGAWAFSTSQTRSASRLAILNLIGALLSHALWLIGLAMRSAGRQVAYGSQNKPYPTLSILSLATYWLTQPSCPRTPSRSIHEALNELISMVQTYKI